MIRHQRAAVLFLSVAGSVASAACFAEAPSVASVLKICADNRAKLDPLHIQATYTEERTKAYGETEAKRVAELEKVLAVLSNGESMPDLERQLTAIGYTTAQFREQIRQRSAARHSLRSGKRV